jgi:diguanylate cyclase (GGDEF)-like protein
MRVAVADVLSSDTEFIEATDDLTASALAAACRPDAIVLDATETNEDALVAILRNDFRTALTPIVHIVDAAPKATDDYGAADDYVVCPFDAEELAARIGLVLHRMRALRGVSPLTLMPGNSAVEAVIRDRQSRGVPFACLYVDIDGFKAFNDEHGFARGDEVIRALARCLVDAIEAAPADGGYVAHVGGDDFIVLTTPDTADAVAKRVVEASAPEILGCSISVGVVKQAHVFESLAALGEAAARAKQAAKEGKRPV